MLATRVNSCLSQQLITMCGQVASGDCPHTLFYGAVRGRKEKLSSSACCAKSMAQELKRHAWLSLCNGMPMQM